MNKKILVLVLIIVVGALIVFSNTSKKEAPVVVKSETASPKNSTYIIDGQLVTLVDGVSSMPAAPNSELKITTNYFGNEVTHDFDGDGRMDTAFIITQNPGGSGTFYYVVVALNKINGYVGSQAYLLGDRIAPQTTKMSENPATPDVIVVNFADRKPSESFAVPPSVGKSIWLKLDVKTMQFGEVVQNFEGEADTTKMTLGMKTWDWAYTVHGKDTMVTPKILKKFTLALKSNKTFSATTDCNGVGGEYQVNGNKITFSKMISTMMYCDGSQEQDFTKMLNEVQSYVFTSKGELVFSLASNTGSMVFK